MTAPLPVAIVGLGPVGATAALLLARYGVSTVVLERRLEAQPLTRAVTIDDEALRVLHSAGVGHDVSAPAMLTEQAVRFRSRAGTLLLELAPHVTEQGHPAIAFLHQAELEAVLAGAVARSAHVTVERGSEVVGLDQDRDALTLTVRGPAGRERRIRVAFLLACDGARSTVRAALGVRLWGLTSRRRWLAIDAREGGRRAGDAAFEFNCDPSRPTADGALPGGAHRFEFMLRAGEAADDALVGRLLEPYAGATSIEVLRWAVYPQHARVASRWLVGRVMLLGDAAHLSPTFAGQGLSAGLRDAANVSWKVAALLAGAAAPALLDSYETERRPHVVRMLGLALALGRVVELGRLAGARDRLMRSRAVAEWAARGAWKPSPRHRHGLLGSGGGALAPQLAVGADDRLMLDDALGSGFGVVGFGVDPVESLDPGARALLEGLGAATLRARDDARPAGAPEQASVALVRPDRFVFAHVRPHELAAAVGDLAAALRSPPRRTS